MFYCPQCGDDTETLNEGVCEPCRMDNQQFLDEHNAHYDEWRRLSPEERETGIRSAVRLNR